MTGAGLLRTRERTARVTNVELFFDLVYVFAVTQLSHYLLDHRSVAGAGIGPRGPALPRDQHHLAGAAVDRGEPRTGGRVRPGHRLWAAADHHGNAQAAGHLGEM